MVWCHQLALNQVTENSCLTMKAKETFTLFLNMFPDKRFVSPYMKSDFPVAVVLRKRLFFEVSVTSSDKQLSVMAERCFATPTQDQKGALKYEFITKG